MRLHNDRSNGRRTVSLSVRIQHATPYTRQGEREWTHDGKAKKHCADQSTCGSFHARERRLTTQAQRPGAREAMIATATLPPGSLQRLVRRFWCIHQIHEKCNPERRRLQTPPARRKVSQPYADPPSRALPLL